jgi:hypothetical protein
MPRAEPGDGARIRREAALVAVAVGALHVLLRLSGSFLFGAFDDDGIYVSLGKAIAEGAGYRSIYEVGAPLQLRFPPGLPLLLAIPWALGGTLEVVRATVAAASAAVVSASAGLIWWIGRRQLAISPWPLAVCALLPLALEPAIQFYNLPLSEPYFLLGWAAALALAFPVLTPLPEAGPGPSPRSRLTRVVVVGLVVAGTTLFRAAGIALVPGVLAACWLRRRRAEAIACGLAALLPLAAWAALRALWVSRGPVSAFPDDLGYWRWLGAMEPLAVAGGIARATGANIVGYVSQLAGWLSPIHWLGVGAVIAALLAIIAAGVVRRQDQEVLGLTVLCVTALTLVWPYTQGRLVLPILPFAGLLLAGAVDRGVRGRPPRVVRGVQVALGLVAVAVAVRQVELRRLAARSFVAGVPPRQQDRSPTVILAFRTLMISRMSDWVARYTSPQDRIMIMAPSGVYLYTGRQTVSANPTESPLAPSVFSVPGRYLAERLLADSLTVVTETPVTTGLSRDIRVIQSRCPGVLTRALQSPDAPVYYRVRRDESCLQDVTRGRPARAGP